LKVTIAKWLTPNGHSINESGLEPDIAVEIQQEDIDTSKDPQLEKAIKILQGMPVQ
ncbi:MAG: S41 family peptidase, partial [Candidatus Sungbacteria bacterium]|nr:S41 family peptidase [Candidatus Sungbacteria bacterium]